MSYVEEVVVAVERMTPRGRADFTTVPDGHYVKEYALLVAEIAAVGGDGFASASQKRAYLDEVLPAWERVRNTDDKENRRGLLAIQISDARTIFRKVMGEHWTPSATNGVAQAAEARGLTLAP